MLKANENNRELWISDIVCNYYTKYNQTSTKESFIETLSNIIIEQIQQKDYDILEEDEKKILDNTNSKYELFSKIGRYLKKNVKLVFGDSARRNIDNLFSFEMNPSRKTIFQIVFALKLDDVVCERLLKSAEQLRIHYGGDKVETAIYYCLKYEKIRDYNKVKEILNKLNEKYTRLKPNSYIPNAKMHSQRTIYNRNISKNKETELSLTSLSSEALLNRIVDIMVEQLPSYTTQSDRFVSLWTNICRSDMSKISQILYGKKSGITADEFIDFYGDFLKPDMAISQTFSKFGNRNIMPTREFVCLLLIYWYYKDYANKKDLSLCKYINEVLNYLELDMLNESNKFDSFICELSKYSFESINDNFLIYYDDNNCRFIVSYIQHKLNEKTPLNAACLLLREYQNKLQLDKRGVYLFEDIDCQKTSSYLEDF